MNNSDRNSSTDNRSDSSDRSIENRRPRRVAVQQSRRNHHSRSRSRSPHREHQHRRTHEIETDFRPSNTWGNKRRGSASSGDESRPSGSTEQPENRWFGRPFRFKERFGFPFSRTFDGSQPSGSTEQPENRRFERPFRFKEPKQPLQPQQPEEKVAEKPPQVPNNERGRKQNQNIQQSNTVDLGGAGLGTSGFEFGIDPNEDPELAVALRVSMEEERQRQEDEALLERALATSMEERQKQDHVHDPRGQRSMSASPENRAGQQRNVSMINYPIHGEDGDEANPQQTPPQASPKQQQQQASQQSRSNERAIPIHVEGQDEPGTYRQQQQQPQYQQQQQPPASPSRYELRYCPVCFESLTKKISCTTCGHIFCTPCILKILKTTKLCPTCRARLTKSKVHSLFI